jgi:predicted PurR-regulated permease PerM
MERDFLIMIYGAIMGVVGSIVTSIVTVVFQMWLERREYQRRQSEEHNKQLRQIHIPTNEEILMLNADHPGEHPPETARTAAEAGSIFISLLISSAAVYNTKDPILGFAFGACLGFLLTRRITTAIRRRLSQ